MSQNIPVRTSGGLRGILVVVLIVVVIALVIAGLILPPIALPSRLGLTGGCNKTLSAKSPMVEISEGLSITLDPAAKGTLAVKLTSVPQAQAKGDLQTALKTLPRGYRAKGPLFQITVCGARAVPSTLSVAIPQGAEPWETLDVLGWDGKAWQWVGGQLDVENQAVIARVKEVPQSVVIAQMTTALALVASDLPSGGNVDAEGVSLATMLFVPGLLPDVDGGINGDPAGLPRPPEGSMAVSYVSLRNWSKPGRANVGLISDVLFDAQVRATHVKAVTGLVTKPSYAGVQIDYRGLSEEDRAAFADFITQLADSLHKINKKLVVVPSPLLRSDGAWDTAGYDLWRIGAAADSVQLELLPDPTAYGASSAEALVQWAVGQVSRAKLQLGVTSLSVDQAGVDISYLPFDQALKLFGDVKGPSESVATGKPVEITLSGSAQQVTFDPATGAYRYTYVADGRSRAVVLGSASSLAAKLNLVSRYRLRGVTIHGLVDTGNDPGVFTAVQQYAAQTPAESAPPQVVWTVQGAPAATSPLTQTQFMWTPGNAGNYTIAASISGVARGQTSVTVGAPAPTPTLVVTSTMGAADCTPQAQFVSDVTIPDNSKVEKGASFTKTWRVKNSGTCDWPADTVLAFVSGNKMSASDPAPVGVVKVGETKDVSVEMKAPDQDAAGVAGLWRFKSSAKTFGNLTVVITSGNPQVAQPTQQPAPPTQTPQPPTATPVKSTEANYKLWADRYTINTGECVTLYWKVENVQAIFFEGEGVAGEDSRQVCPRSTRDYHLAIMLKDGNMIPSNVIKITVN